MVATVVVTDTLGQMVGRQLGRRLDHCSLAGPPSPLWLDRVEPRTLAWQEARNELHPRFAYSTLGKYPLVVSAYPVHHLTADMPGSIVPDEHQHPLALRSHILTHPFQVRRSDMAYWTTVHEAQQHLVGVVTQQPIATQRLGVQVLFVCLKLLQAQWRSRIGPSVHSRPGQAAPPYFILITHHPTLLSSLDSSLNQAVSPLFFAYIRGLER